MRTNLQKDKFQMQHIHGIGLKIGAIALFTVMFALVKALSKQSLPGRQYFSDPPLLSLFCLHG